MESCWWCKENRWNQSRGHWKYQQRLRHDLYRLIKKIWWEKIVDEFSKGKRPIRDNYSVFNSAIKSNFSTKLRTKCDKIYITAWIGSILCIRIFNFSYPNVEISRETTGSIYSHIMDNPFTMKKYFHHHKTALNKHRNGWSFEEYLNEPLWTVFLDIFLYKPWFPGKSKYAEWGWKIPLILHFGEIYKLLLGWVLAVYCWWKAEGHKLRMSYKSTLHSYATLTRIIREFHPITCTNRRKLFASLQLRYFHSVITQLLPQKWSKLYQRVFLLACEYPQATTI